MIAAFKMRGGFGPFNLRFIGITVVALGASPLSAQELGTWGFDTSGKWITMSETSISVTPIRWRVEFLE
jgi:hypothetical protein